MVRKIPCQYCKQRRRKCERICESEPCKRCIDMKRACVPQEDFDSSDDEDLLKAYEDRLQFKAMNQQVELLEQQLKTLQVSLNKHRALINKEPIWDIEFINGQLVLKSEINSLEELMLYGKSVIRYLSPFNAMFKTATLKFGRNKLSFIKSARYVANCINSIDSNQASSPAIISQRFTSILVEYIKPESLVDMLIDNFFQCINDVALLLHEPSYREHYNTLKDPLTDPITLAICTAASIFTCRHSSFVSNEKRYFGEYFFKLTMDKLTDIFDDPEKELESLVVINLIQMFMVTTLRINECKKWMSIGTILANSLHNRYPDCFKGNPNLPRKTRIMYATIHRNDLLSECFNIIGFITSKKNGELAYNETRLDILPDESDTVKDLITIMNHIFQLASHPIIIMIITQVRKIEAGEIAELNFEELIQYENVVAEWWTNLPQDLKICKDPYNCSKELISKTQNVRKLVLIGYLNTITLNIQSCLIAPLDKAELENVNNTIRNRAIHLAMYSADMAILISKKLESIETISASRLLMQSIDSIMSLLVIKDPSILKVVKTRLEEYMYELSQNTLEDHQVSQNDSPFKLISNSQPGNMPSITELYKNYSLPANALVYDIIMNTIKKTITV